MATSPCEVTNCFCAPQLNIMKIQGVPGNAVMCGQTLAQPCQIPGMQIHTAVQRNAHIPSLLHTHIRTHLFAWWTFIRMQSRGIMWFKQSRSWQTRSPAELKISPNTLRDQIIGPYVDLAQSSQTCVCGTGCACVSVSGFCVWHVCTHAVLASMDVD